MSRLRALALLPLAFAVACAQRLAPPVVPVEEVNELSAELASEGLEVMRGYVGRLRAVSDPLRLHGTGLCRGKIVPYVGLELESHGQGTATPLSREQRRRGVGVRPTVVRVTPGSPAEAAGIHPGDVIRTVGGREVITTWDARKQMGGVAGSGPNLGIERAGEAVEIALPYTPACFQATLFSPGSALTTASGADVVVVTRGLMDFVRSDDELAILIAHEMAHRVLSYGKLTKDVEAQADRLSLLMASSAGYDIRGAAGIWERLAIERPEMITTHPRHERDARTRVYHGYVAERTLLMPALIAELLPAIASPSAAARGASEEP